MTGPARGLHLAALQYSSCWFPPLVSANNLINKKESKGMPIFRQQEDDCLFVWVAGSFRGKRGFVSKYK